MTQSMECGEVLEILSDYVDGLLDDHVRTQVDAHLESCSHCQRFGASFGGMIQALRATPRGQSDALITRLKQYVTDADSER